MKFTWTGEVSADVGRRYVAVCSLISEKFDEAAAKGEVPEEDSEIHFCPVVMKEEWIKNYPARSRVDKRSGIFYCAPHLDYNIFLNGDFRSQLENTILTIASELHRLKKLGLDEESIGKVRNLFLEMLDQDPDSPRFTART